MASPEEVSGSHALTTAEQLFCTLTAWHERVSVYVIGAGIANLAGAKCNVYAINGSQRTLLATGKVQGNGANEQVMMSANQGSVAGQGDTIALYVQNPYGVTAAVKIYMVGWDPTAAVTPVESSSVQGVTLTLNEQTVGDLAAGAGGGYVNLNTSFNPNGDPLSVGCRLRLYALLGGADRVLMNEREVSQQEAATTQAFSWLQNFAAGANEFVMTAQGRLGNSAITVTGVLAGTTGSAGAGGGGGTLAGDVIGPIGANIAVKLTGAAGVLAVAATAAAYVIAAGAVNPSFMQATATTDVPTQAMVIQAQGAFAGATGANQVGGDLIFSSGHGTGAPEVDGAIRFRLGGNLADTLLIQSNGIVVALEAIAAPEFVVTSSGRTPVIESTATVPGVSMNQPGSLSLGSAWNSLFVQSQASVWQAVPVIDLTTGQITLDPAATTAGINQAQSTTGAGSVFRIISQQAKTGSTTNGGDISFILGCDDPPAEYPALDSFFWFGRQTALDGHEGTTDYFNFATLAGNVGGTVIFNLGRGTNGVGGGLAGCEISSFSELSVAVENYVPINNIIAGAGPTSTFLEITHNDTVDEAAWSLAYFANHPTSGDVAGVQILYTQTAIGSGVARYIDLQDGGVRQFSIRPYSLGGVTLQVEPASGGYFLVTNNAAQITMDSAGDFGFAWAGVLGFSLATSGAQLVANTKAANTSFALQLVGTQGLVLEANTNLAIGPIPGSYGGGAGVIFIANDTTDPTSNPVGGGILFASGGSLKWRNPSGVVTPIAP